MPRWTPLAPLPIGDYLAKATAAAAKSLNDRIVALLNDRGEVDRRREELTRGDAAELPPGAYAELQALAARRLDLLASEVNLRKDVDAFHTSEHADASAAAGEASEALEAVEASVRKRLVKIGYHDVPVTEQDHSKITPGMVHAHPDFVAARQRIRMLSDAAHAYDGRNANRAALQAVRDELERARSRIAAG